MQCQGCFRRDDLHIIIRGGQKQSISIATAKYGKNSPHVLFPELFLIRSFGSIELVQFQPAEFWCQFCRCGNDTQGHYSTKNY